MALSAIIDGDGYNSLPDALKSEYKQRDDGSFMLDVIAVQGMSLENVTGLRTALEKERQAGRQAAERLKAFGDLDPERAKEAVTKVAEFADWDPERQVEERMKERQAQLVARHAKELEAANAKAGGYKTQLTQMLVDNAALKALQEAGGNSVLLLPHVRGQVRMREVDGNMMAEVYNPQTGAGRVGDSQGGAMTISQLVAEMKSSPDFAAAFAGSGQTGSGSAAGKTGSPARPAKAGAGGVKMVSRDDQDALNNNWEGLLDGSVQVS